ncbi:GATA zinc finger domain-containing protein 1-like [Mizuhopecten yessoensis]|uniref:GATA zinc finger domain-containing protein 1 n=1 Tax=Mizuhopecten yessoensis TaxID=6573 RepID=A0A210QJA7_MIZYE|nr:GATA zinc finger domain-containing protein 1-like [Mizuhopecten yessoensis]OWF48681.1 GATA zinc finger domain-containing protein 1 [Mizuhopecten yessoensis]
MPLGSKPICSTCKTGNSAIWRKGGDGEVLCNACSLKNGGTNGKDGNGINGSIILVKSNGSNGGAGPVLRKSARIKPSKHKFQSVAKAVATKGKSRRIIFKKSQPVKAPTAISTVITGESVFHDGSYFQIGDIVSLVDHDSSVYYAQIRGFMKDQYNEKSAIISWLLPSQSSPTDRFDPATYILGPEEDLPRKMEFMEFVCHAPSDYFKCKQGPYPTISRDPNLCYVWTNIRQPIQVHSNIDDLFTVKERTKDPTLTKKIVKEKEGGKGKEKEKVENE